MAKHNLSAISCQWLDSASVVRRTWSQWARKGYGLPNVCGGLGISYKAHDAVEDAWAAGQVLLHAIATTGLGVGDWLCRVKQPVDPRTSDPIAISGNPDGFLSGEEMVFTGALTLPRREAASLAAKAGCDVANGVKKTTTILVVGDQDIQKLHGHEKSNKHRKAEELIAKGQVIRILRETDFLQLVQANV
jgi:DNA polymerase-3 subunit epsilon